jgi:hypothetical protein
MSKFVRQRQEMRGTYPLSCNSDLWTIDFSIMAVKSLRQESDIATVEREKQITRFHQREPKEQ